MDLSPAMSLLLSIAFPLATGAGPMDEALRATEAPDTLRAAFTVEMTSDIARRVYGYDPRDPKGERWTLISADGFDEALDEAAQSWATEVAPDGRLFPDDLRASLGEFVEVDDMGAGWRLQFQHAPSANDSTLDIWATQRLDAEAWLEPIHGRFLRIDYSLPKSIRGPNGGRLTKLNQSYLLETEPEWDLTYVSQFSLEFEAKAPFRTFRQSYKAVITEATFFFASSALEQEFVGLEAGALTPR